MPSTTGTRSLNIALLSVRVDDAVVRMALNAAEERYWAVSEASFNNYISSKRRPHFSDRLRSGDGCVALIDFDDDPMQAAAAATYLQQVFAGRTAVIALAQENQPQLMLLAMRAGCTEFLTKPVKADLLSEAMRRVEQQLANRNAVTSAAGSVLAIMGAKGGVGTTTLAVHLASFLAQDCGKKVLLIDNQSQFGHVCIYLGLDGSACHFQEIVRNVNRLDSELLRGFVAIHSPGLDVLSSPDVGQIARALHPEDVAATLEFLRSEYDFVLVDCAGRFDDVTRAVISTSSQVYVVATPEISAVRDLSRYVDDLTQFDDSSKVKVVINRYSSQFAVSLEEIEKAIRLPVSFNVPNSYVELVRSANLGVPLNSHVNSGFTNEVMRWAKSLVGAADEEFSDESAYAKSKAGRLLRSAFTALSGAGMRTAEKRA
jgi:pilus assembly protein CpaE